MRRPELAAATIWRAAYPEGWGAEPVDLGAVASYLGVEILTWLPAEEKLNGVLIRSARTVFVNAGLSLPRMRFVVAHELGHLVLGHDGDFYCPFTQLVEQEREANRFAAALLMPRAVVKTLWLKLSGLAPPAKISALAKKLAVSRQALGYRLRAVGIGDEERALHSRA